MIYETDPQICVLGDIQAHARKKKYLKYLFLKQKVKPWNLIFCIF
jgi:hypothetical protein